MAFLAKDFGTSWDEPVRWGGGDRKLAYYEAVFSGDEAGRSASARRDLYPGFFDLNLAWLRRVLPFSDWAVSRGFTLLFGLLGVLGVILLARRLFPGSEWWSFLFVAAYPGWFGHQFMNPKDVPFAAMYVISLWLLVRYIQSAEGREKLVRLLVFAIVAGLTAATRVPGLALFGFLAVAMLCEVFLARLKGLSALRFLLMKMGLGAGAVFIGIAVLFPWWPFLHSNPVRSASEAVAGVSRFEWEFPVLFWGEYIPAVELPLSYIPVWILFTTPPALLLAAIVALVAARRGIPAAFKAKREAALLAHGVVALAVIFPLLYIVLIQATLYNGLRHVLFIILPAIALISVGWARGLLFFNESGRPKLCLMLSIGVPLLYVPTVVSMARLHPYQYIYFNALAGGVKNADGLFDLEYWGTSYKEAIERMVERLIDEGASGEIVVNMEHPTWMASPFLPGEDKPFRIRLVRSQGEGADFYLANTVWGSDEWWAGEPFVSVDRLGVTLAVVKDRRQLVGEQRVQYYGLE